MRIVVVGATGTAVLRRLSEASQEVVGMARRLPDRSAGPYANVEWRAIDVGDPASSEALERVFAGADAVIHLAQALQPNRDERLMRRTNVEGTARVLAAAGAAQIPHVIVASSAGAYSFGPKRRRVDESRPTGGLPTSHYARHKAANERAMDAFEKAHPEIVLTRMRPGLVFQRAAGAEIAGLFLGRRFPTRWLSAISPPVVPLPSQSIFQAVHADDLADAIWRAAERRAGGPFNIAAEPVLRPDDIARALGARRIIPVRAVAVRALLGLTWRLRLRQADPGWLDIATGVPIMSTERARRELEWAPTISSTAALREVIDGITLRSNIEASGPLRA